MTLLHRLGVQPIVRSILCCLLILTATALQSQSTPPETRSVADFEVHNTSRLAALARLGALTQTSILVEADTMPYLQAPISLSAQNTTVFPIATEILRGVEPYSIRQQGVLLIIFSTRARSHLLTLPLGPFSYHGKSLSSLLPFLSFTLRFVTGCNPQGYAWAGPPMDLDIPPIDTSSATIEQIIAQVAEAPQPTMWIIPIEPTPVGCINNPEANWEVGFYGFGASFSSCDQPLSTFVGPYLTAGPSLKSKASTNLTCTQDRLPTSLPAVPLPKP